MKAFRIHWSWYAWGVVAIGLIYAATLVVDPVLIVGGSQCETSGQIHACTGYPPTGALVLAMLAGGVIAGGQEVYDRVVRHE